MTQIELERSVGESRHTMVGFVHDQYAKLGAELIAGADTWRVTAVYDRDTAVWWFKCKFK